MAHHVNIAGDAICPELDEKRKCFARARQGGGDFRTSSGSLAMLAAMIYPEPEKAVGERLRNPLSFRFTPRPFLKPAPLSPSPGRSLRWCATSPGRRRVENRHWSRASTSRSLFRDPSGPFNSVDSLFEHTSLALQICIR